MRRPRPRRCEPAHSTSWGGGFTLVTIGPIGTWLVLTEASTLAEVCVLPYAWALRPVGAQPRRFQWKLNAVILIILRGQVVFGAAAALGLFLGPRVGLGARPIGLAELVQSAAAGIAVAVAILLLETSVFRAARRSIRAAALAKPPLWASLLTVLYGGIAEEVLMRFGLQTALCAGLNYALAGGAGTVTGSVMWAAIALSALAFGAGHLPAMRGLVPLTGAVVIRTVILNSLGGLLFGWLYWKHGIVAAMAAHTAADFTLRGVSGVRSGWIARRSSPVG